MDLGDRVKVVCFIPARMGASRFPGKVLTPIAGRPMLEHCCRGAAECNVLDEVVIATCDPEIEDWARSAGIASVMTSPTHERATDRVAEAAARSEADVVVLVQGDEPLVTADMVDAALGPVLSGEAPCTNLIKRIDDESDFRSLNTVKVLFDLEKWALAFSRSPVPDPGRLGFDGIMAYKQVAVFAFSRERLLEFSELPPTPLEVAESVDMLRYLEHGRAIRFVETERTTHGVDVPEDVAAVERILATRDPVER
jgi:3-deoxy-manno-octulosonate cytidylyltransferase (CMP-KDO synthetase)